MRTWRILIVIGCASCWWRVGLAEEPAPTAPTSPPAIVPAPYLPPSRPVPRPRLVPKMRYNWAVLGAGIGVSLVSYGVPAGLSFYDATLAIPIVGAIVAASHYQSCTGGSSCGDAPDLTRGGLIFAAVLDALLQLTGVTLIIIGLATRHRVYVQAPVQDLSLVPTVSPAFAGFSLSGRF